jgi:hypothetical protein
MAAERSVDGPRGRPFDRYPRFRAEAGIGRSVLPLIVKPGLVVAGISSAPHAGRPLVLLRGQPVAGFTVYQRATGGRITEAITALHAVGRRFAGSMRLARLA